jgi:phage-related protein
MSTTINPSTANLVSASVNLTGKTPYELNSAAFGPVAASAIGVGQVVADAASTAVTFSEDALRKLSSGAHNAVTAVEGVLDDVEGSVGSAYDSVSEVVSDATSSIGKAASSLYGAIADITDQAADYTAQAVTAAVV